jgi:hypothetical protein
MKELRVILYGVAILSAMFAAYLSFQTELIKGHSTIIQEDLGSGNLIDTSKDEKVPEKGDPIKPETVTGRSFFPSGMGEFNRELANPMSGGADIYDVDFENYSRNIDRPFDVGEIDIEETRAEGMGVLDRLEENAGKVEDTVGFVILSALALLAALWLDYRLLR